MKIAALSAWSWTAGERTWQDAYAPAPDPEALDLVEAAVDAGWFGITTMLDEHGLRCIAAADGEIALVTVRGLNMDEALRVAAGIRFLEDWSIANLAELVRQACDADLEEPTLVH